MTQNTNEDATSGAKPTPRARLKQMDRDQPIHGRELVRGEGCSMIFLNQKHQVLLYQRDDKPSIPEPKKWDLFGGHVEAREKPDEAIVREIAEELGLRGSDPSGMRLTEYHRFRTYYFADRDEHVYWSKLEAPASDLEIKEGQNPRWFSESEIENLEIAFGFKAVLRDFFQWRKAAAAGPHAPPL